jgi:hypothetical protein
VSQPRNDVPAWKMCPPQYPAGSSR